MRETSVRSVVAIDDLLARAAAGERDAQRDLAACCEQPAFAAAYGVYPKPDRARLAGQYALGQVLLKLRDGERIDHFWAYLRRAAVNAAIVLLRKDGRFVHLDDLPAPLQESLVAGGRVACDPEQAILRREIRDRVLRALQRLPERQRMAFTYVVLEGLSYAEAGEAMRCDPMTVGSQLFRARERLRQLLQDMA